MKMQVSTKKAQVHRESLTKKIPWRKKVPTTAVTIKRAQLHCISDAAIELDLRSGV